MGNKKTRNCNSFAFMEEQPVILSPYGSAARQLGNFSLSKTRIGSGAKDGCVISDGHDTCYYYFSSTVKICKLPVSGWPRCVPGPVGTVSTVSSTLIYFNSLFCSDSTPPSSLCCLVLHCFELYIYKQACQQTCKGIGFYYYFGGVDVDAVGPDNRHVRAT